MYNCYVKVYQSPLTRRTAPIEKNHEPLKKRRRVIYYSGSLQEINKPVYVVFSEVSYFTNKLEMKWYKLFKNRCQFQTVFCFGFLRLTYCCELHATFHREK